MMFMSWAAFLLQGGTRLGAERPPEIPADDFMDLQRQSVNGMRLLALILSSFHFAVG